MRQAAAVCVAMEPELPSDQETLVQGTRARSMRPRSERVLLLATTSVVIAAAVFLMSKARPHNTALRTNAEAQLKQEKRVCPTPGEKFDQPQKGCPSALDASSCLAGNKKYDSFQEAWAGCGTELECGFVMRFGTDTGYEYYLRRNSDPSMEMDNADSMTYSCREEVKASSRVPSHRACSLPDYYEFDLPQKGCPQPSNSSCVRNNQNFPDLAQAWLACAEEPECGVILRWGTGTGYVYYLRRRSDPSVEMAGAESMLFSCSDQSPTTSSMIKKSTEVCSPAAGNFDLPPKRCSPLPVGCIGKNERYTIFAEAWAACGQSSECDLLMQWTDGRYYLRRDTDPDISAWTSGGSLRYSCDTRGAVITAPALAANQYASLYSESGKFCHGIPQIDSLGAPVNPDASPVCWQIRLSEQKRRMEPRVTYNSAGHKFPESKMDGCKRKLGAEYDFYNPRDNNIFEFTAKSMGQRIINVGAYDPVGMCAHGQVGNPNCCNWTGTEQLNYDEYPHLCWRWPNDIPWDGTTLVGPLWNDQLPSEPVRILEGFAQQAGCKGGKGVVPGTNQTWCDNADQFWRVGCQNVNENEHADTDMAIATDCGLHPQATMYVYQLPPFSQGDGDGSEFMSEQRAAGIYASGWETDEHELSAHQQQSHPTYRNPKLAPVGTKFGDAQTTDGKTVERDDYGWAFKQMHGKGYACIDARVKMLDECEEKALLAKGIKTMPPRYQIGIFSKTNGTGKQWPALLRMAGNRNSTVYDWHDVRVNGFAIKLYDAHDVTGENGGHRVNIADIPRSDYADGPPPVTPPYAANGQPYDTNYEPYGIPDAKAGFKGGLSSFQNVTTVDFLFVAIRGQGQGGCHENTPECLYNIFPAGGNGRCYSPMFLYGHASPEEQCHNPEAVTDTHATWNPLNYTYGSSAALMLGNDGAFKMMVQPCGKEYSDDGIDYWDKITNKIQDPADPNFKANNLNDTLKNSSMQLCIFAQIQENPCTEPIEDATVKWNTDIRLTGRIYIEAGVTALYNQVCDNTVFNPYRALTSHMPIGSLQRIRQAVYAYAAQFRLYRNHAQSKSPDEMMASELPLRQPNSDKAPQTPPPMEPRCPLGF